MLLIGFKVSAQQTYWTPGVPTGSTSFTPTFRYTGTDSLANFYLSNSNRWSQIYSAAQSNARFLKLASRTQQEIISQIKVDSNAVFKQGVFVSGSLATNILKVNSFSTVFPYAIDLRDTTSTLFGRFIPARGTYTSELILGINPSQVNDGYEFHVQGRMRIDTIPSGTIASGKNIGLNSAGDLVLAAASGDTTLNGTGYVKMSGTTPSYIAAIPNADLANSTISGVSLGSNLFSHTPGLGLTGSAYNGSSAQGFGLDTAGIAVTKTRLATNLTGYAKLASPALTGTPTAPTATVGTNTTQIATTAFVLANGGGLANSNFVVGETPSGTINGTNTTFTLANTPVSGSVQLSLNGQSIYITSDYTISGSTITMNTAPYGIATLSASYRK